MALGALYASNLKRAEVRLVPTPEVPKRLGGSSWGGVSAFEPGDVNATVPVLAYNSGARGGLLVRVDAGFVDGDRVPFESGRTLLFGEGRTPIGLPLILTSGQSVPVTVEVQLALNLQEDKPGEARLRELIRRMEEKKLVNLILNYSYVKGFSLLPWRRGHPIVARRKLPVELNLDWVGPCKDRLEELLRKRAEGVLQE